MTRAAHPMDTHERSGIPALIEVSGATWRGFVHGIAQTEIVVISHGYPPVTVHQEVALALKSSNASIEVEATVKKLSRLPDAIRMLAITFHLEQVDEFTHHRLRRIMERGRSLPGDKEFLHAIVLPAKRCETLIRIDPQHDGSSTTGPLPSGPRECSMIREHLHRSLVTAETPSPVGTEEEAPSPAAPPVMSHALLMFNRQGRRIAGFWDCASCTPTNDAPVVIIAPAYGETKRDSLALAYYLATNGFHVIRYDHTDHVGESDGEHLKTTLSQMHDDLQDVVDWARRQFPGQSTAVVATSLAARVALKALGEDQQTELLILLNPIVDMQATLQAIHREDLLGDYLRGQPRGITNILGFNVDGRRWLADAHEGGYTDLTATIHDASRLTIPVIVFSSEHDAWVDQHDVAATTASLGARLRSWFVLPSGLHRLPENPRLAKSVYRQVVRHCREVLRNTSEQTMPVLEPDQRQLGKQKRRERSRRQSQALPIDSTQFWNDYLAQFDFIANSLDYQQLLDHLVRMLGPLKPGARILDAGCGNGILAACLLACHRSRNQLSASVPCGFEYIGIDLVATALRRARQRLAPLSGYTSHDPSAQRSKPSAAFLCGNLNAPLPFPDRTFDAVASNLVIGYLHDPQQVIREYLRVLTPGGTLVLTNLKPNSDLSRIFCNFVEQTNRPEEIEEARRLLSNAGRIREAEGDGIFTFYEQEELSMLLRAASGGLSAHIFPTFADQAYIAVLRKPDTATDSRQELWHLDPAA